MFRGGVKKKKKLTGRYEGRTFLRGSLDMVMPASSIPSFHLTQEGPSPFGLASSHISAALWGSTRTCRYHFALAHPSTPNVPCAIELAYKNRVYIKNDCLKNNATQSVSDQSEWVCVCVWRGGGWVYVSRPLQYNTTKTLTTR